jgi:hypothetical protein
MVRSTLNCKPGKVRDLVDRFKALNAILKDLGLDEFRLYTDVSGEAFWTMVAEREFDSLGAIEEIEKKVMADSRAQASMDGYHELVVSGKREIFKVEA